MESETTTDKELEQLKVISENQVKLLKKLEELENKDNEEEEKLKYIQNNINNLFQLINSSIKNQNSKVTDTNNKTLPLEFNNKEAKSTETEISTKNINSINIPNNNNNNNTINEILESRESKILFTVNEFEEFIGKIIEAPSSFYRQNIIENAVNKGYMFSIQQIGELLNLLPYMSEKKNALKILNNSIHDYYHKQELLKYLNEETEERKQELCDILFN